MHTPGEERGEVVYEATKFYSPDVIDAWIRHLEREMAFFRIHLTWKYLPDNLAEIRTDSWTEEVIEKIELSGCTLENFAACRKSEERPH